MPVITLTEKPNALTPTSAMLTLWEAEITAHALYPLAAAHDDRRRWVEKVLRQFAKDWTDRVCVLPIPGEVYQHWFALHAHSRTDDEDKGLKANDNRDLKFAARLLISCTLGGVSKAKSIKQIANELVAKKSANSLYSAETTVKRAWRRYRAGCHFLAAQLILDASAFEQTPAGLEFATITTISLAEKLRTIGEATKPVINGVTVLDAAEMWKVPDWFPLSTIKIVNWNNGAGTIVPGMTLLKVTQPFP
jgi:hypothetical protein